MRKIKFCFIKFCFINKTTVEDFYQVEELWEGVSEDGAWGQVTRQRNGRVI